MKKMRWLDWIMLMNIYLSGLAAGVFDDWFVQFCFTFGATCFIVVAYKRMK